MGSIPVLKPGEVCRLLERLGFAAVRQRGSHVQYRHPDGRGTTVPLHKGRDIAPPLLYLPFYFRPLIAGPASLDRISDP